MDKQLVIRIDEKTKAKFYELARMEGKTASDKVREMIEAYIQKADIGTVVDGLWRRIGAKIKEKGFKEGDIDQAIGKVRSSK